MAVRAIKEMLFQMQEYLTDNFSSYATCVKEHLVISFLALIAAVFIGVLFGYACLKYKRSEKWITVFFGVLRIIPSLAVLILLIPIMGTGVKPAMTALILLAIPPILMNTVAGFKNVPDFMVETAQGLGMTHRQILWKVKIPLALPLIMTGIKTAFIEIIASATLAAKIGAGGLGDIIFTGLGLYRIDLLLVGGLSVAILSVLASVMLDLLDRLLMRHKFIK